jgi:hypothetical protein
MALPKNLITAWVDRSTPAPDATGVSRDTTIQIKFTKRLAVASIVTANFELHQPSGTVVSDAWEPISLTRDYDSIGKLLTLRPSTNLVSSGEYSILVQGLTDAGESVMSAKHIFSFVTGLTPSGSTASGDTTEDIDDIIIEDYAIQYPYAAVEVSSSSYAVSSDPFNGQINISSGYASGAIILTFGSLIDTSLISVAKEDWNEMGGSLAPVSITVSPSGMASGDVIIQMPATSGVYFSENTAYHIDAIYQIISFTGILTPLYVSPSLIPMFLGTDTDAMQVARYVYMTSKEIALLAGMNAGLSDYTHQENSDLAQLALYMTLHRMTTQSGIDDFQLGQLRITNRSAVSVTEGPYASPFMFWWKKVMGGNGIKQVLTIDREGSQFAGRMWNSNKKGTWILPRTYTGRNPRSWE